MVWSVGQSSAWKPIINASVGVGGVWKPVLGVWVGVGGAWKFVWAPITGGDVSSGHNMAAAPTPAFASVTWQADGTVDKWETANVYNWLGAGGVASDYDIYFTHTGGIAPSGSGLLTWLNLGTDRNVNITSTSGAGIKTSNGTYQIRHSASGSVVASGNWSLSAESYL